MRDKKRRVDIYLSAPADVEIFKAHAAAVRGMSLSAWVRQVLLAAESYERATGKGAADALDNWRARRS